VCDNIRARFGNGKLVVHRDLFPGFRSGFKQDFYGFLVLGKMLPPSSVFFFLPLFSLHFKFLKGRAHSLALFPMYPHVRWSDKCWIGHPFFPGTPPLSPFPDVPSPGCAHVNFFGVKSVTWAGGYVFCLLVGFERASPRLFSRTPFLSRD